MCPSKCLITCAQVSWYAVSTSVSSSGSSCWESAVEPTRSQNITVSWRRVASTSSGPPLVLATVAGRVGGAGSAAVGGDPDASAIPQPPQNFSPGSFTKPQTAHGPASAAPHSLQKRRPSRLATPHLAHCKCSSPMSLSVEPGNVYRGAASAADGPILLQCTRSLKRLSSPSQPAARRHARA